MWFAIVLGWIVLCILAGVGARNKGRSFAGYFFLSLFLSPLIGLIAMAVAKPLEKLDITVETPENAFFSKISGVTQKNPNGISRQDLLKHCEHGEELELTREPENKYDKNAIKICRKSGDQLGYVRSELAKDLAPRLDAGEQIQVFVSEITGGEKDTPTLGCNIRILTGPKVSPASSE